MRTTIEVPDSLMQKARQQATEAGVTLKELFISALESRLESQAKVRREPPTIEGPPAMRLLTREEIDEAIFG